MAICLKKRQTEILSESHVKAAREAKSTPNERALKPGRLQFIVDLLEQGLFCRADIAYAKCNEDGETYRVNGNHTTTVLTSCLSNPELPDFPENIPLVIEYWGCDTIPELIEVFKTFDNRASGRTAGDHLTAFMGMHLQELDGIEQPIVNSALQGVNYAKQMAKNPDDPKVKADELGTLLAIGENIDFCHFIQGFKDCSWNGYKNTGICAAMYRSWIEDEDAAKDVWACVMEEEDDDPRSDSRKFVSSMRTASGKRVKKADWFYNEAKRYWSRHRNRVNA